MEKTATINVRVDPEVKRSAEAILKRIGLPISTAIDIYLNKIIMTGGIPFALTTPMSPPELNMDLMTEEELVSSIEKGRRSIAEGRSRKAKEVFDEFMERHGNGSI
jgi:addiction module RelB/DinJ family antitoxin